jgi:1-acyl-sn-glycerol-3-phosphate acyltransferase
MLTTVDNVMLVPVQTPHRSLFLPSAWPGEMLRQLLLFPALRAFVSIRTNGNKLPGDEAYIFVANHSSHLDAPVVLAALPLHVRMQIRIAAAADYFFVQCWKGAFVRLCLNAFPFERKQPGCQESLTYAERLLQQGHSVLIFPEGTRTRDGHMQRFKYGVGYLASKSGVKVIPIWIDGTFAALPRGAKWPQRQAIVVQFGAPLRFSHNDHPTVITAEIERAVHALAGQEPSIER